MDLGSYMVCSILPKHLTNIIQIVEKYDNYCQYLFVLSVYCVAHKGDVIMGLVNNSPK